jgi:3-carboxy-cis,cis-muconate cycloisomerase
MDDASQQGLFGALFSRGAADTSDEAWLAAMLTTEAALARAAERAGLAPPGAGAAVTAAATVDFFDANKIGRAAVTIGNPVSALVKDLTALVPPEYASAIHLAATSQDIIDTATMLLAKRAITTIQADLAEAASASEALTRAHARTVMAGRTLLQQAVPITFGLMTASWLTAIDEARRQLHQAQDGLAIQYGGAAGTLAPLGDQGPAVAELLAEELGLATPILPWHTDRSRILHLAAALATTCATLGKIARDVTLLAQSEVAEVHEGSAAGHGGSSTMPQKRNPVVAIIILGNTKQAPALLCSVAAAAEQELQRAAGAWHAEWQPLSHLLQITGSAAAWSAELLAGLVVDPARMRANLDASGGLPMAEHVTTLLTPAMERLQAHELVAAASARAFDSGMDLADALCSDEQSAAKLAAAQFNRDQLEAALLPESYLGATPVFIQRALAAHEALDL